MAEWLLILMLIALVAGLLSGFPVAFVLSGVSLLFALLGHGLDVFDMAYITALPNRIYGIMTNDLLIAVPLFVFMGMVLERAKIAEELLEGLCGMFGNAPAGLGLAVVLVGALLAASTGIVGATVVTMGLISLPTMLKYGYHPRVATGTICAAGTLGQIIPPSIVLILLGDQISGAYQTAQMKLGNLSSNPVSIADLFVGALLPGLGLVVFYMLWLMFRSIVHPGEVPATHQHNRYSIAYLIKILLPPLALIALVLGSILTGIATATESAAVGAIGSMLIAAYRRTVTFESLRYCAYATAKVSSMVFTILVGAACFTLVFRGLGGDDVIHHFLSNLPGGFLSVLLVSMLVIFLLGFFLDFIEIIFVVVPIITPVLLGMGAHPVWLAVMIAINLQTSFLTPPFGFALFYLRGVAPESVKTSDIYRGIIPFVVLQLLMLVLVGFWPELATWLPEKIYGTSIGVPDTATADAFTPVFVDEGGVDF